MGFRPHTATSFCQKPSMALCPTGALHATNYVPDIIVIERPKINLSGTNLVVRSTPDKVNAMDGIEQNEAKEMRPNLCPTGSLRSSPQTGVD